VLPTDRGLSTQSGWLRVRLRAAHRVLYRLAHVLNVEEGMPVACAPSKQLAQATTLTTGPVPSERPWFVSCFVVCCTMPPSRPCFLLSMCAAAPCPCVRLLVHLRAFAALLSTRFAAVSAGCSWTSDAVSVPRHPPRAAQQCSRLLHLFLHHAGKS
jgi:hypothetical protein